MRCICLSAIAAGFISVILSGCTGTGISATASYNPGYGPFDQNGNYVEAWADKPAKSHWWSRKPKATAAPRPPAPTRESPPLVASNTPRSSALNRSASTPRSAGPLASLNRTTPVSRPPVAPPRVATPSAAAIRPTPPPAAATPPRPKPRPVKVAPKKPAPVRHTVRKGDTLYGLSRRYGASVSAIQRANGLSGSTIRIGQSLRIPR